MKGLQKAARLADVNHRPEPVLHQTDAGLVRQVIQLLANVFRHGHAGISTQRCEGAKGIPLVGPRTI